MTEYTVLTTRTEKGYEHKLMLGKEDAELTDRIKKNLIYQDELRFQKNSLEQYKTLKSIERKINIY